MATNDDNSPDCNCGPLEPQDNEKPIKDGTTPDQILSQITLACDDHTGVFFFRYNRKLYMRMVDIKE